MFPKSITYLTYEPDTDLSQLEEQLASHRFLPCTDLQIASHGWSAPTEEGTLVHTTMGVKVLRFTLEKKTIPGSGFRVQLKARCAARAKEQGHECGRKQRKEISEQLRDELLPRQLASRQDVMVLIDTKAQRLLVDSTVPAVVEAIISSFIRHAEISLTWPRGPGKDLTLATKYALEGELGAFSLTDYASVEFPGETKTQITYRKANLWNGALEADIERNGMVMGLGLTTEKISFVLTNDGAIKSLKPLDILRSAAKDAADFDASVMLATLELRNLINNLETMKEDLQK